MSSLTVTWLAAGMQVFANAAQQILSVYWTEKPAPLFGLFLFILTGLGIAFTVVTSAVAIYYRDWSFFWLADTAAERSLIRRLPNGQLTQAQMLLRYGALSVIAALAGWYATPPDRTPPLIQSISGSLPIVAAMPLSGWLLGDHKRYLSLAPLTSVACIVGGIIVSLIPIVVHDAHTYDASAVAWSLICIFSQIVTGLVFVCSQAYLIRSGVLEPGVSRKQALKPLIRILFFNQVFVLLMGSLLFWIDLLPWFGKSHSLEEFSAGTSFSFSCSFLGHGTDAAAQYGWVCDPKSRIYGGGFILAYVVLLVGITFLNQESAVFNTMCAVLNTAATSVFWLIPGASVRMIRSMPLREWVCHLSSSYTGDARDAMPLSAAGLPLPASAGTNPNSSNTPVWSAVTGLVLSLAGVLVFKLWEHKQGPAHLQFALAGGAGKAGAVGGIGGIAAAHAGSALDMSHLLAEDDDAALAQSGYFSGGASGAYGVGGGGGGEAAFANALGGSGYHGSSHEDFGLDMAAAHESIERSTPSMPIPPSMMPSSMGMGMGMQQQLPSSMAAVGSGMGTPSYGMGVGAASYGGGARSARLSHGGGGGGASLGLSGSVSGAQYAAGRSLVHSSSLNGSGYGVSMVLAPSSAASGSAAAPVPIGGIAGPSGGPVSSIGSVTASGSLATSAGMTAARSASQRDRSFLSSSLNSNGRRPGANLW